MNLKSRWFFLLFVLVVLTGWADVLHAAGASFEKGMAEFRRENYEEALALFENAYKENSKDPQLVLYLGLTRREMQDYPEAVRFIREAIALDPKIENIQYLLADVLFGMGNNEEALDAADAAIKAGSRPAQSTYLKGLILSKLGKNKEAVEAYRTAKQLDPSLAAQADFQIATALVQAKDYKQAKKIFQGLITTDPASDWALYSKDYLEALEKMPKPYRLNVMLAYQHDDNVLAVPLDKSLEQAAGINKQKDWKRLFSLLGEYTVYASGPWNVKASYGLDITQYDKRHYTKLDGGSVFSQDTVSHTLSLMPTYNTENSVTGLLLSYNYMELDYTKYMETYTASPSYTFVLNANNFAQAYLRYRKDDQNAEFSKVKFGVYSSQEEDRDANNYAAGLGYFHAFAEGNGLFNLRAELEYNDADGANWDYSGVKVAAGFLYPLLNNRLKANIYGELYHQNFLNSNSFYLKERKDNTTTLQASLTYTLAKPLDVSIGYAYIKDDSNLGVFEYKKNLYTLNMQYRF